VADGTTSDQSGFVVYWRPACWFCSRLFRRFDRHGLAPERRNIWEDADARRFLNDEIGSETVPTVVVDGRVLVNPSIDDVLEALGPDRIPD
jgi:glutaredoxin